MKDKGFTLIELLAVIIILGILMLIAIPSVTNYINNSRKETYLTNSKELLKGATTLVNSGELDVYDPDTTYYIDYEYISTENPFKSPYGDIKNAYVVVTYDGENYDYYWTCVDATGVGVKDIVKSDNLSRDSITTNIDINSITPNVGIGSRSKIKVFKKDGTVEERDADYNVSLTGGTRPDSNNSGLGAICKRATVLHDTYCVHWDGGCGYDESIELNEQIMFGNQTVTNGVLTSGDAFDCDVNGDGTYDAETERFYYITSDGNNAVLLYYSNVLYGSPNNNSSVEYDSSGEAWHGPRTAYEHLPSTSQWSNPKLIAPGTRQIVNEQGGNTLDGGNYTIESFTYTDKAARLLTYQEVQAACPGEEMGTFDKCPYLLENVRCYDTDYEDIRGNYWLETPYEDYFDNAVAFNEGGYRYIETNWVQYEEGVRPAITVLKTDIEY